MICDTSPNVANCFVVDAPLAADMNSPCIPIGFPQMQLFVLQKLVEIQRETLLCFILLSKHGEGIQGDADVSVLVEQDPSMLSK